MCARPRRRRAAVTTEGRGRTVYFPWNLGGIFWEVLAADHQRLIENAVRWALNARPRVEVDRQVGARRRGARGRGRALPC